MFAQQTYNSLPSNPPTFLPSKKRVAFTLAETLITLGIIGVVAALTLPSLIQNYRKQQTVTGLKKAYSIINQAMKLSEVDNGPYNQWENGKSLGGRAYIEKYWLPYLKNITVCDTHEKCGYKTNFPFTDLIGEQSGNSLVYPQFRQPFITGDGILYTISVAGGAPVTDSDKVFIDINGAKGPNKFGVDYFVFVRTEKGILPYGYDFTDAEIKQGCAKQYDQIWTCAARIMRDGWQISKDYPW